jgi:hypothetical protein
MLTVEFLWNRNSPRARAFLYPLLAIVIALLVFAWYDLVVHRWLIWVLNGERASMAYQTGTRAALLQYPVLVLSGSVSVFATAFSRLMGEVPDLLALLLLIALVVVCNSNAMKMEATEMRRARSRFWNQQRAIIRILIGGILMLVCLYGMIARHHPIMKIDVRHGQYVLPLTMVFVVFLGATMARVIQRGFLSRGKLQLVLLVLVASNLASVLTTRVFGYADPFSKILLMSLRNSPELPSYLATDRGFARIKLEVMESPVYKALHAEMTDKH